MRAWVAPILPTFGICSLNYSYSGGCIIIHFFVFLMYNFPTNSEVGFLLLHLLNNKIALFLKALCKSSFPLLLLSFFFFICRCPFYVWIWVLQKMYIQQIIFLFLGVFTFYMMSLDGQEILVRIKANLLFFFFGML